MAEVVTLSGVPFTPEQKQVELTEKQKSVVATLEDYLSRAKAGQYSEMAFIGVVTADDSIDTNTSDGISLHYIISGLEILKFRLLENRNALYREVPPK